MGKLYMGLHSFLYLSKSYGRIAGQPLYTTSEISFSRKPSTGLLEIDTPWDR